MRKTLIIISQRAQAVDVTARANVTFYYKCVKTRAWFWPFATYFKVYRTEEMDVTNFPIWEEPSTEWKAELWHSHFATDEVYSAYNSWYLRAGTPTSQVVHFEAYELTTWEKIVSIFHRQEKPKEISEEKIESIKEHNISKYLESTFFAPKTNHRKKKEQPPISTKLKDIQPLSDKSVV